MIDIIEVLYFQQDYEFHQFVEFHQGGILQFGDSFHSHYLKDNELKQYDESHQWSNIQKGSGPNQGIKFHQDEYIASN